MDKMISLTIIIGYLLIADSVYSVQDDYFCSQFFSDIRARSPLLLSVPDNAEIGAVIAAFTPPRIPERAVYLSGADTALIDFDYRHYALIVKGNIRERNGQMVHLKGQCGDFIMPISVRFNMSISFILSIDDVNDPPVLDNLPAVIHVPENTAPQQVLYTVAVDSSFDITPEFMQYYVQLKSATAIGVSGSAPRGTFTVTQDGRLILNKHMDYEYGPRKYKLVFTVKDGGGLVSQSSLTLHVTDVDDMSPKFDKQMYYLEVIGEKPLPGPEACYNTTPAIHAEDQDAGNKSAIIYSITEGSPGGRDYWGEFFKIDPSTGYMCQKKTIERLLRDDNGKPNRFYNFTFTIKASQVDDPNKFDMSGVFVHVLDSNEHAPEFDRRLYRTSVPEFPNLKVDTPLLTVKALDRDYGLNGEFHYELVSNPENIFKINSKSGKISIANPKKVDREKHSNFQFKVRAIETKTEEKKSKTARVNIQVQDINDHSPVFSPREYNYVVKDTLNKGEPLNKTGISASDKDLNGNGKISYTIQDVRRHEDSTTFTDLGRFGISLSEGVLYLAESFSDLRRKKEYPMYTIVVKATDNAARVDDRRSSMAYVNIKIVEANDHAPRFQTASRGKLGQKPDTVPEDAPVGTKVISLEAEDQDGDGDVFLKYSIVAGNDLGHFTLKNGGWIMVAKPLDRERIEHYKLKVQVTDGKHTTTTDARIRVLDVNDNAPLFPSDELEFPVPEHLSRGSLVGQLSAEDPDLDQAGTITYTLEGKHAHLFTINQDGSMLVKQPDQLDSELRQVVSFKVIARDNGTPQLQTTIDVHVNLADENDNPPIFDRQTYRGKVKEGSEKIEMESPIVATDADISEVNRNISFSLQKNDLATIFAIHEKTGALKIIDPSRLDSERTQSYTLQVIATDKGGSGHSTLANVILNVEDVNDNAPEFLHNPNITLKLGMDVGTMIGRIQAQDRDVTAPNNHVIYMLKGGGYGKFGVDYESGEITVVDNLSREPLMSKYILEIEAMDLGIPHHTSSTNITIQSPYNRPPLVPARQTIRVRESAAVGTRVGRVQAVEEDETDVLHYVLLEQKVPFRIDSRTGVIVSTRPLDAEAQSVFYLPVSVHDSGLPPLFANATIIVSVQDVNDNAPRFDRAVYKGEVTEDDAGPLGKQIVIMDDAIRATDGDISNSPIRYELLGPGSRHFSLDQQTGTLYVSKDGVGHINADKMKHYDLKIRATDPGGLSSVVDLTVEVTDENDISPEFIVASYEFDVPPGATAGQVVGSVSAHDQDATSPNNRILYILETDPLGKFKLDPFTGALSITQGLFHQPLQNTYTLRVAAMDLGEQPNKVIVMVTVNAPNVGNSVSGFNGNTIFYVPEEVPFGTVVGTLSDDEDDDKEFVIDAEKSVPFAITKAGKLVTSGRLDSDAGPRSYLFTVHEHGGSSTSVGVIVQDINDTPPLFSQPVYTHMVSDRFPIGTIVATPFAFDDIDIVSSLYTYSMYMKQGTQQQSPFNINPNTGVVYLGRTLPEDVNTIEYRVEAIDKSDRKLKARARLIVHIMHTMGGDCCCVVPCSNTTTVRQP